MEIDKAVIMRLTGGDSFLCRNLHSDRDTNTNTNNNPNPNPDKLSRKRIAIMEEVDGDYYEPSVLVVCTKRYNSP